MGGVLTLVPRFTLRWVETWPRRDSNLLESEVLGSSLAWYRTDANVDTVRTRAFQSPPTRPVMS